MPSQLDELLRDRRDWLQPRKRSRHARRHDTLRAALGKQQGPTPAPPASPAPRTG